MRLEVWGPGDLELLRRLVGDPEMMAHLGGPESPQKIRERQARYERMGSGAYKIVDGPTGDGVGWVGFWDREWRGGEVYETGWSVVPEFQGRGIARAATAQAISLARAAGRHGSMHAFPNVDNAASNAICRALGFELLEALGFEYPPGHVMRCNDWHLALSLDDGESQRARKRRP